MKMKNYYLKAFFAMVLSLLLGVGVQSQVFAAGDYRTGLTAEEQESVQMYSDVFLSEQSRSTEHYFQIQKMLRDDTDLSRIYGGSYIDINGRLTVYLTIDDDKCIDEIKNIDESIIISACDYSYAELSSIMDKLNDYKNNKDNLFGNEFDHYMIADSRNRIEVYFETLSEEVVKQFRDEVCDSGAIDYLQSKGDGGEEATIKAGAQISTSSAYASVGYRVKRNGVAGIVTAAHFVNVGNSVSYGGSTIGSCTARAYSGQVDAAFVKVTDGTPSNTINGGSTTLSTTISEPGSGTVINKRGATTGSTSGTVYSTNASWTINGVTFTNLTAATYDSDGGDSGGVVYSYISSTGTRYTLGIHKGRKDGYAHYVKANSINSALGTSRY